MSYQKLICIVSVISALCFESAFSYIVYPFAGSLHFRKVSETDFSGDRFMFYYNDSGQLTNVTYCDRLTGSVRSYRKILPTDNGFIINHYSVENRPFTREEVSFTKDGSLQFSSIYPETGKKFFYDSRGRIQSNCSSQILERYYYESQNTNYRILVRYMNNEISQVFRQLISNDLVIERRIFNNKPPNASDLNKIMTKEYLNSVVEFQYSNSIVSVEIWRNKHNQVVDKTLNSYSKQSIVAYVYTGSNILKELNTKLLDIYGNVTNETYLSYKYYGDRRMEEKMTISYEYAYF